MKNSVITNERQIALRNRKTITAIKYIFLIFWGIGTLFPFLWILNNSLRDNSQILGRPFLLPNPLVIQNYFTVLGSGRIPLNFLNSLIYSACATLVTLLISCMASYAIIRIFKSNFLFIYFIAGFMIPIHAVIIPMFIEMKILGVLNTRLALILLYIAGNIGFSIFVLSGFIKTIPLALEEAAIIDGASKSTVFFRIILPLCKPGLATVGTFVFLGCWNDFLGALLFASKPELATLNLAVFSFRGLYQVDYGPMNACIVLLIIPVVIIYILFQEQVIKGLSAGALKG